MDDRELLELAAKAADMHPDKWGFDLIGFREYAVSGVPHCGFSGTYWNPLTDDGDALRLAVKIGLTLARIRTMSGPHRVAQVGRNVIESEPEGDDPCAAMRRAIVRAAAGIGKQSNAALSGSGGPK